MARPGSTLCMLVSSQASRKGVAQRPSEQNKHFCYQVQKNPGKNVNLIMYHFRCVVHVVFSAIELK
jgi:hypothetical protein